MDVKDIASFTDYFLICNGSSSRLLTALAETLDRAARTEYKIHSRIEGNADTGWILLDMGDIVVHLFSPDQRKYYDLEELWNQSKIIVKIQ